VVLITTKLSIMLKNPNYSDETQIKWWALYYEVLEHLIEKGLNSALREYPAPIVRYFENWRKLHKKEE